MLKPRCGFYLKREGSSQVGIEVYDLDLLVRSLDTPEFREYCKDLAQVYGMKPEVVEVLVYLQLILNKAERLGMSPEELKDKLRKVGFRVEKIPEDQ